MYKKNYHISINRINGILFFLMFLNFGLFLIFKNKEVYFYSFVLYVFIFILFLYLNFIYFKETKKIKSKIIDIIKNDNNSLLKQKYFYEENNKNNSLINNILIRKNLLRKDFGDLEKVFYKFTSHYFLNQINYKGNEKIELGENIEKDLHVMFLDIIGFSHIAENIKSENVLLLLNIYFDGIVEIIKKHGGFIDKFLGDGILAIFVDKYSDNAIKASIEIQKFISNFRIAEIGRNIYVGIGINSGNVIIGTIGSSDRMEVTIIGDTVNTASKIEGLTRNGNDKILLSKETYDLINNKKDFNIRYLGEKILKGKQFNKKIYGVEPVINIKIH